MSYVDMAEKLYLDHELLKKQYAGLESLLEERLNYIKQLEDQLYKYTGTKPTHDNFVGKTDVKPSRP